MNCIRFLPAALLCTLILCGCSQTAAEPPSESETLIVVDPGSEGPTDSISRPDHSDGAAVEDPETTAATDGDVTWNPTEAPSDSLFESPYDLTVSESMAWNALTVLRQTEGWEDIRIAGGAEYQLEDPQLGWVQLVLVRTTRRDDIGADAALVIDILTGKIYGPDSYDDADNPPLGQLIRLLAGGFDPAVTGVLYREEENLTLFTQESLDLINSRLR